jgi:hypothetical protein
VHQVERVNHGGGHRNGAVDAFPALLEALEDDRSCLDVDAQRGQFQGFRKLAIVFQR